jgi:tRNA threonylcarbamoyladenosine biosynthesis protein TsaE
MHIAHLDESALQRLAYALSAHVHAGDVLCLSGPLGAGKTTFARGLLRGLGLPALSDVASPTYTLVHSYAPPEVAMPVAHIDLYRLDTEAQVAGLGLEDMMDDHVLIVEWPERWGQALPAVHLQISISGSGDTRSVDLDGPAPWQARLAQMKDAV